MIISTICINCLERRAYFNCPGSDDPGLTQCPDYTPPKKEVDVMSKADQEAYDKLKAMGYDIKTELDRIIKAQDGKNCAGVYIIIGYLAGIKEALQKA